MDIHDEENRRREVNEALRQYFLKHPEQFLVAKRAVAEFSLEDKFRKGHLTLNDLDWLIVNNTSRAVVLGLRLSRGYREGRIYGQIFQGEVKLYEFEYTEGHVHTRIAEMQFDFDFALTQWEKFTTDFKDGL